ncbi:hypothetical protein HYV50_05560 [Candidatus Pacearchaeota archaeon]|nr:hypothetical protein [Candidatus Pacearchaeota archaeon]
MKLADFIAKAKKSTYASGAKPKILEDGFEELSYEERGLHYRDRWKGTNPFGGEEIVKEKDKVIWIMNYYGIVFSIKVESEKVYEFLRKAMNLVSRERPFRGPSHFKEGDFEYFDKSEGTLDRFKGIERILYMDEEVYRLEYHGGKL